MIENSEIQHPKGWKTKNLIHLSLQMFFCWSHDFSYLFYLGPQGSESICVYTVYLIRRYMFTSLVHDLSLQSNKSAKDRSNCKLTGGFGDATDLCQHILVPWHGCFRGVLFFLVFELCYTQWSAWATPSDSQLWFWCIITLQTVRVRKGADWAYPFLVTRRVTRAETMLDHWQTSIDTWWSHW